MFAYVGLASYPVQIQSISADRVTLKTNRSYAPGLRIAVELVNDALTFKRIFSLRVDDVQPNPDGSHTLDAAFCHPLTDDELRDLD
jgi:hypothetical protein